MSEPIGVVGLFLFNIMEQYVMSEAEGLDLIERFIFEKRGVKIKAIRPANLLEMQLFHEFTWVAFEYFESKKNDNGKR